MAELQILNNAINVLKNECSNNESCEDCILGKVSRNGYIDCRLHKDPCNWENFKGAEE